MNVGLVLLWFVVVVAVVFAAAVPFVHAGLTTSNHSLVSHY